MGDLSPQGRQSAEEKLQEALLTMDVVDEIRHHESALAALADDESRHAELRDKLLTLYRSQGLVVSVEQIDAGIQARRARRFTYVPPSGFAAKLALAWIKRWQIFGAGAIALAAVLTAVFSWKLAVTWPAERKMEAHIAQLADGARQLAPTKAKLMEALEASRRNLEQSVADDSGASSYGLIGGAIEQIGERARGNYQQARSELDRLDVNIGTVPTPNEYVSEAVGFETRLSQFNSAAHGVAGLIGSLNHKVLEISELKVNGVGLQRANEAVLSKQPTGEAEVSRREILATGESALAAGDLNNGRRAVAGLQALAVAIESIEQLRLSADKTLAVALGTGVSRDAKAKVEGAYQRTIEQLRPSTLPAAQAAHADLAAMTQALASEYSFTIVSRSGTPSALGRRSNEDPNVKNMYAIVEALDGQGRPSALPLVDELTGSRKTASVFGVRITHALYEEIARDKKSDGIVDDKVIGRKRRGELTPEFGAGVLGGYIVDWDRG